MIVALVSMVIYASPGHNTAMRCASSPGAEEFRIPAIKLDHVAMRNLPPGTAFVPFWGGSPHAGWVFRTQEGWCCRFVMDYQSHCTADFWCRHSRIKP